jgi:alcohol dehydrogenase (cytochrome c)
VVGIVSAALVGLVPAVRAARPDLENPKPEDWLMYSRTYDAQRFSPLKQINRQNVGQLRIAWTRGFGAGTTETIPVVHDGVIYVAAPGAVVQALDGTNGELLWEYKRKVPANVARSVRKMNLLNLQGIAAGARPAIMLLST